MRKVLVIFDGNGRVYTVMSGVETLPEGLDCTFADAPDHFSAITVNPDTKEVEFGEAPVAPDEPEQEETEA